MPWKQVNLPFPISDAEGDIVLLSEIISNENLLTSGSGIEKW